MSKQLIQYFILRARQARRDAIKDHIETMLNIKGKVMPSAKEELGNIFDSSKTFDASHFFAKLHRTRELNYNNTDNNNANTNYNNNDNYINNDNNNNNHSIDDDSNSTNPEEDVVIQVEPEEDEEAYSDFTEKLQSFYPECKSRFFHISDSVDILV